VRVRVFVNMFCGRISRKTIEIEARFQWITNRKCHMANRMVTCSMMLRNPTAYTETLAGVAPYDRFSGLVIFDWIPSLTVSAVNWQDSMVLCQTFVKFVYLSYTLYFFSLRPCYSSQKVLYKTNNRLYNLYRSKFTVASRGFPAIA